MKGIDDVVSFYHEDRTRPCVKFEPPAAFAKLLLNSSLNGYAFGSELRGLTRTALKGGLELRRTGLLLRLELPSNPEILCVVRSAVMRLTEEIGFPEADCRALTRAVDEALANIIRHAYDSKPEQPIELLCRRMQNRTGNKQRAGIEIVLVDHGTAADRKKLRGRALDDIRPGGLGLHFIQDGVDVMQYTSQAHRNRLRLVKYLPGPDSQPKTPKGE
jgi:serine/threonine-protein kinase RsbW